MRDLDFFEKIGLLADKGVDVRSQSWNVLVRFRASLAHSMRGREATLHAFARILQERYPADDMRQSLSHGMERLKESMRMICFESWGYDESVKTKQE